ncbi:DUF5983 family protein [Brevibacillus reuszeri]|uniref:DUF5983 family protein n=1 Tax=Brevibacillus reuszeri TaxID=54915 RepID=UPI0040423761
MWCVCVPEDHQDIEDLPVKIRRIFSLASEYGCEWIMFDGEGAINELLPTLE